MTKSGPATAIQNQDVTYAIGLTNNGPSDASNVTLSDTVPTAATFVSFTQNSGPAFSCSSPATGGTGTVSCTIAALTVGSAATFTMVVHTNAAVSGGMTNTANAGSSTTDPNGANNSAIAATNLVTADVAVTKSATASVGAGGNISYAISVINNGPADATTVTLTDILPANTTFVSMTQNSGPTFVCSGTTTVTCSIATLANAAAATFTLVVKTAANTPPGALSNTATVSSASPLDPTPANNTATASTTILVADLAVTKVAASPNVVAGNNATWTIVVTNNGPSDATSVTLTDVLPANTTLVSMTQTGGATFVCAGTTTVTCTGATLVNGATATFTLVTAVAKSAPAGALSNTASVSATSPPDQTPANNSVTASTTVTLVNLGVTKNVSPPPYGTGQQITWTIGVTNSSSSTASNVTVTDVLPTGTTLVSATPSQGSCSGNATVTCSLGTLAGGASATISLIATLPATAGPVTNTATVSSANGDSNPANDSASSTVTVIPALAIPALDAKSLLLLAAALSIVAAFMMQRE